jgi:uncharacterized membrane protein YhaH (DUF805 family)
MRVLKLIFSFSGKLNRPQYWMLVAPILMLNVIAAIHFGREVIVSEASPQIAEFIIKIDDALKDYAPNILLYLLISTWIILAAVIRRLRDVNLNIFWAVLAIIPKLGVIFILVLGFLKPAAQVRRSDS